MSSLDASILPVGGGSPPRRGRARTPARLSRAATPLQPVDGGQAEDGGTHPGATETGDPEEACLVAAYRAGDPTAFERIYRLHHRYVQLQARRVISDPYRAEDIAQEAFLRLTRQLQSGDGQIRLRAWLHRTTTNLAIDEHRRARTRQQYQDHGSPLEDLQRALERQDPGHPERMAEQSEVRAVIMRVVDILPDRYRRILALRELEGLDYPSIAAAMQISVSAVESLLFRARRRFTEVYQELTDEGRPTRTRRRPREGMAGPLPKAGH